MVMRFKKLSMSCILYSVSSRPTTSASEEEWRDLLKYMHQYFVYIMSSLSGVLYIGFTSDLRKRVSYIAAAAAIGSGLTTTGYYKLKAVLGL